MKLFIPPLGTMIRLTKDWSFELYCEPRNKSLWDLCSAVKYDSFDWYSRGGQRCDAWLPAGTLLKVDRIYIRKNVEQYNSVTFRFYDLEPFADGVKYNGRFWARLNEVNRIECDVEGIKL